MKKKLLTLIVAFVMLFNLTACGFSIGNTSSGSDDYDSLFPDTAAARGTTSKTSQVGYDFSLGDYGSMKVYVDTSFGHSFELLTSDPAGFIIKDSSGNDAVYAVCLDKDAYADFTSVCDEVKTINGRDYLYRKNGDGSEDICSYMADCGLDVGLVLEIHDGNQKNFGLVAFRGTPIDGASSDVYAYQGTPVVDNSAVDDMIDANTDNTTKDKGGAGNIDNGTVTDHTMSSSNSSSLDPDVARQLASLNTDYPKVHWENQVSFIPEYPGIVGSAILGQYYDDLILIVAITNLYDTPVSISVSPAAYDQNGDLIADTFMYESALGGYNTTVDYIWLGDEIAYYVDWNEADVSSAYGEYIPWLADWSVTGDITTGSADFNYSLYTSDNTPFEGTDVAVLFLDADGYVTGFGEDYISTEEGAKGKVDHVVTVENEDFLKDTTQVAMFSNTVVAY